MWVVFLGSVLTFGFLGVVLYKFGHETYMSCKREELEFEKEREEE